MINTKLIIFGYKKAWELYILKPTKYNLIKVDSNICK